MRRNLFEAVKVGDTFDDWTVIENPIRLNKKTKALCRCSCGAEKYVDIGCLLNGQSKSCGCTRYDKIRTHGKTNTRLFRIWRKMKERCYNQHHVHYSDYGGRGITICSEWKDDFQAFYDWAMSHGYSDNLSIDRADDDKGYYPENCRWATALEQQNNTRFNRKITYEGRTLSVARWADELGMPYTTLYGRLTAGWDLEKALFYPVDKSKSSKKRKEDV